MPVKRSRPSGASGQDYDTSAGRAGEVRHRDDAYLRLHRFVIHRRPPDGPNLWTRDHKVYREDIARRLCRLEDENDDRRHQGMKGGL